MCNSKRSNRFRSTDCGVTPPLLSRHGQPLSLERFMKELMVATDDIAQSELVIVNDNAKSPEDSKILSISTDRRGDTSSGDEFQGLPPPIHPPASRLTLSRWDSGEAKPSSPGTKSISGLCAPKCPKKPSELSPRKTTQGQNLTRRRVTFSLPYNIAKESTSSYADALPRMFGPKVTKKQCVDSARDSKRDEDHKPRRRVTFSRTCKDLQSSDVPLKKTTGRSSFSLLEAIFEHGSFSEMSSEDFSITLDS